MTNGFYQPPSMQYGAGPAPTYMQNSQGQQQRVYNDKIHNIANRSFPANHLITVGLIYREVMKDANQKHDFKDRYFFFVTLAPGLGDGANRTYSWDKNQKVTMKFSLREISALSFVLKQCAIGNDSNVLPYTKFSRSEGQSKNCSVWISSKLQNMNNQQVNVKVINLSFNGNARHSVALSPAEAYSMGEELDMLFKKGLEMEIAWQQANPQFGQESPDAPSNMSGYEQPAAPAAFPTPGNVPQSAGFFNPQPPAMGQQMMPPSPYIPPVPISTPTPNVAPQSTMQHPQSAPGQYAAQPQYPGQPNPAVFPSVQQQTQETASQFGQMLLNNAHT